MQGRFRRFWGLPFLIAGVAVFGCAEQNAPDITPRPGPIESVKAADMDARADAVRRDPVAYLGRVRDKCAMLQQYTLLFTRVERRGVLIKSVVGPEQIMCWFRRKPFSVRMKWLDESVKYGESTYVEGQEHNQVRFIPRHGLFGLPPGLTKVDLQTPVTWGEAQRPLTEWGLENLVKETLDSIKEVEPRGGAVIEYRGVVKLQNSERPVHYIYLDYPRDPGIASVQELYTDVETDLPAGTVLRFADGKISATYLYENVNTDVKLADNDFILDIERGTKAESGAASKAEDDKRPAAKPRSAAKADTN